MTNQELKLECFRLSGRGFNPLFEEKLHEAKRLYEWVVQEEREKPEEVRANVELLLGDYMKAIDELVEKANEKGITFEDSPPVEVELSSDQKTVVAKLREEHNKTEFDEDWVKKLMEASQPTNEKTPIIQKNYY